MLEGTALTYGYFIATAFIVARRPGRLDAHRLGWWATSWCALLPVLAATLPIVSVEDGGLGQQPRQTLVGHYGVDVLWQVSIPLVVCLVVVALLAVGRGRRSWVWELVAVQLSFLLLAASVIGTLTFLIGAFVFPSSALLLAACLRQRADRRRGRDELRPISNGSPVST